MASYDIAWKVSAEHDLRKIDRQYIKKILSIIDLLSDDPFPGNSRKIKGAESIFRIRIGDYRAVYQVNSELSMVTIYHVRHRKDAYKR